MVRGGGGVMYMIPQLQTFVAGGTGQDYGGEPTGATLIAADGSCVQGNAASFQGNPLACAGAGAKPTVGNITSVLVAPQSATSGGVVTEPAVFPGASAPPRSSTRLRCAGMASSRRARLADSQ